MEQKFISMMIADYDQLFRVPREGYEQVIPILRQVQAKRNTLIKPGGSADLVSRYLCEGFIGLFYPHGEKLELLSIFQATDTVFDEFSYRSGQISETVIKSISAVVFLEFPISAEELLLHRHPEFSLLAHRIAHRISERKSRVHSIAKLGLEQGYELLMKEFPGLEAEITNSDLASFFGVHTRTVERWKHNLKDL
ncbi:CRP-like cAMP-binding protein [Algoriphagus aquaeductus]|uniref:CRP-like cAMP-binding protein n=1 Tax=Algoriphagus aquaeductus TaxID=475299 RepID=A0A326RPN9_9BACT|nr:hypothetical protein [Algoriphagus aquaeductus]PZV82297.1 CRP-like cAMP-binding protein [Algoriphagus aquaeductus]